MLHLYKYASLLGITMDLESNGYNDEYSIDGLKD